MCSCDINSHLRWAKFTQWIIYLLKMWFQGGHSYLPNMMHILKCFWIKWKKFGNVEALRFSIFSNIHTQTHISNCVTLMSLRNHSESGGDNNISLPSYPHSPVFSASDWEISCPRRVLPTAIIMGYSDLGASCFLQLKLLHFVRIINYLLDESKVTIILWLGHSPGIWEASHSCINE